MNSRTPRAFVTTLWCSASAQVSGGVIFVLISEFAPFLKWKKKNPYYHTCIEAGLTFYWTQPAKLFGMLLYVLVAELSFFWEILSSVFFCKIQIGTLADNRLGINVHWIPSFLSIARWYLFTLSSFPWGCVSVVLWE